jgi:hypothetical protein
VPADPVDRPGPTAPPAEPPGPPVRRTAGRRQPAVKVTVEERRLKVTDLIRLGRVRPGTLTARYDGTTWTAKLLGDGGVEFRGQRYSSLSAAGAAVKVASRGPDTPQSVYATDGWEFWSATDGVMGETTSLKEIRRGAARETGQ